MSIDDDSFLIRVTLQCAVPLWIEKLRPCDDKYILARAHACADEIASHGDNILFKSKRKGATATAFNALAEGLACLAFSPGGVKFLGDHYEADARLKAEWCEAIRRNILHKTMVTL